MLLAVAMLLAAAGAAWWIGTDRFAPPPTEAAPLQPLALPLQQLLAVPPETAAPPEKTAEPPHDSRSLAEAEVERVCPWPPDPLSWQVLGAPCLAAMDAFMMNDRWRRLLDDDHLATRRAVIEAFDRPECRVPVAADADGFLTPGEEARPDLRKTCAADAMARLASLQGMCFVHLHMDLDFALEARQSLDDREQNMNPDIAEYRRRARDNNHLYARTYWNVYRCRLVPPEAMEWVEALPPPPREMGRIEAAFFNFDASAVTQSTYLLEAARRLGFP